METLLLSQEIKNLSSVAFPTFYFTKEKNCDGGIQRLTFRPIYFSLLCHFSILMLISIFTFESLTCTTSWVDIRAWMWNHIFFSTLSHKLLLFFLTNEDMKKAIPCICVTKQKCFCNCKKIEHGLKKGSRSWKEVHLCIIRIFHIRDWLIIFM